MRQAGFSEGVPMYAASGLLTYGASDDMTAIIANLKAAGLCSQVLYKELYIPKEELEGARPAPHASCGASTRQLINAL